MFSIRKLSIELKKVLNSNLYYKNILSVALGTGLAQIIPILFSPILTRIYTPEAYGVFGVYMSLITIGVTLASARYELAIFIQKSLNDSKNMYVICVFISLLFSILLFFCILFFEEGIINFLKLGDLGSWILVTPLIIFLISTFQNYVYWLNRIKNYKNLNSLKIINSGLLSLFNLLFGLFHFTKSGLLMGLLFSQSIMSVITFKKILSFFKMLKVYRLKRLLIDYRKFPFYSLPSTLSGDLGSQLPSILLAYYFNQAITGYFLLASKMVALPFSLIGNSIATVYRQEAVEHFNLNGNCKEIYLSTLRKLLVISILPVVLIMFGSEWLFGFYFGENWVISGKMASYLSVMIFFQLLSTPMADTILFNHGQKIDLLLQLGRLICSVMSFVIGGIFKDYELSIILFSLTYSVYYIIHSIFQYKIARGDELKLT